VNVLRDGRARDEARAAVRGFGPRLQQVMDALGQSRAAFARLIGVDESTLERTIDGVTCPTAEVAAAIIRAVRGHDHGLADLLSRELLWAETPTENLGIDLNRDGRVDERDLPLAACQLLTSVSNQVQACVEALLDGAIGNDELMLITRRNTEIRDTVNAIQAIAEVMNDRHSRRRMR